MDDRPTEAHTVSLTVHSADPDGQPGEPLAHGFLVCTDTALVPDPPDSLVQGAARYLVRVTATSDDGGGDGGAAGGVETITVGEVHLSALDGDAIRSAVAVLSLTESSRYAATVPEYTVDRLTACLMLHRGDLWATYADLGYPVARPASDGPQGAVREMSFEAGSAGSDQAWRQAVTVTGAAQFSYGICSVCHCCMGPSDDTASA